MLARHLKGIKIILGSQSPRRKELLSSLDIRFEVQVKEVDEVFPESLSNSQIAEHLAALKASVFSPLENEIVVTADTIVCLGTQILGKPKDKNEAINMLTDLSGKSHEVITGVVLKSREKEITFSDTTVVCFKELSNQEIEYYVAKYKPFDKAGAYGIQEWIGQIGITKIEGSYFNVMGLPTHRVYDELLKFC
ncbi:MAG: septum formation protein Maf [Flavobacteriales bacterium]|nr:septum formation protein Maf [Flavobacteriales bacterium]